MGIKIKNLQTGEFEKFNIPALKGEKGEPGEIEPSEKVDYIGKQHSKLRDTMNANVDYIIKTAIGEFNYLDYEGQHITATNSIEGHAKSAILSGSTKYQIGEFIQDVCVPVQKFKTGYYLNWETGVLTSGEDNHKYCEDYIPLPTGVTSITSKGSSNWKKLCCYDSNKNFISGENGAVGLEDLTLNIPSNAKYFRYSTNTSQGKNEYINVVSNTGLLLASSNYNIPCELISCKMPVLKTTGKNLFDVTKISNKITISSLNNRETFIPNVNSIILWENTYNESGQFTITIAGYNNGTTHLDWSYRIRFSYTDGTMSSDTQYISSKEKVVTSASNKIVKNIIIDNPWNVNNYHIYIDSLQIEKNSTATSYEPFKSNILSTSEEVVLRSLPNGVCDTLNLNTGEYVQRIGEVVKNNSTGFGLSRGGWENKSDVCTFEHFKPNGMKVQLANNKPTLNCDKVPSNTFTTQWNNSKGIESITQHDGGNIVLSIARDKLLIQDIDGLNTYLQSNPLTIQYELETPIVKTVDLSDNHVYSYKGTTRYDCSSAEGSLVPTLSIKVLTDTQLTIQEQKATTQTLLIKNMDLQQSIKEVQAMNLAFNTALYNSFNSIREEVEDIKKHVSTNENLEGSF